MNYLKSLYTSLPSISINIKPSKHKSFKFYSNNNKITEYPTFFDPDPISGTIQLKLNNTNNLTHQGITIFLYGQLTSTTYPKLSNQIFEDSIEIIPGNKSYIITNEITNFDFEFKPKIKPYETYIGKTIEINYFLKVVLKTITNTPPTIENILEICCLKPSTKKFCEENYFDNKNNKDVNINIGVENLIHVNIKLLKSKYFLDDVIAGKIKIVKSKIQLINVILSIKKREIINIGNTNASNEETIARYELVEGFPEEGDKSFFRYQLKSIKNLSPSYNNEKFSVQYFLGFEFYDNNDYQFFKNVEIEVYRMNLANLDNSENKEEIENKNTFKSIKKLFLNEEKEKEKKQK